LSFLFKVAIGRCEGTEAAGQEGIESVLDF
jgi:hypothetical protein